MSQDNKQTQQNPRVMAFNQGVITAHLATALSSAQRTIGGSNQSVPREQTTQIKNALNDYKNYCSQNGLSFSESIEQ